VISIENVVKTYHQGNTRVRALDGVSLDLEKGEFVAVMGASGSGKSTMLQLLGGLDVPDSGSIIVEGTNLSSMSDDELTIFRRRHIGFVFQFFNLLPSLTVEENVALPLRLDRATPKHIQARVDAMLERVGLEGRQKHKPSELSGGEMQRVAVARAMVIEPKVLLADEPTGNLDSKTGDGILELIKEAVERSQQTVVMVTHDARAAAIGDRTVTIQDGRIVADTSARGARRRASAEAP